MVLLTGKKRQTHIVEQVNEVRRFSQMKMEPDRSRWEVAQSLFRNQQDWGKTRDENPWMSRVFIPLFSAVVRQGGATAYNMIFSQPEILSLESDDADAEFTRILQNMLRYELGQTDFETRFYEGMLIGSIYGVLPMGCSVTPRLAMKPQIVVDNLEKQDQKELEKIASKIEQDGVDFANDEEGMEAALQKAVKELTPVGSRIANMRIGSKKVMQLGSQFDLINPFNRFWEPNVSNINDTLYDIEQQFWRFYQLEAWFENGILDPRKRKDVLKGGNAEGSTANAGLTHSSTREGQDYAQKNQLEESSPYFPECELLNYYGPLLDKDGAILEENKHFVVVNDVLCKDQQNPYYTQESPYYTATFSKVPFKGVGAGVADPGIDQNLLMNDIFSLYMDMLKLAVLNPTVYDSSKIADPSQLENGIEPAALIEGLGDAGKIFYQLPVGVGVGASVLQAVQFLQLTAEQGSSVDTQESNPSSRARITAEEIRSNLTRQGQSQTTMGAIVDNEVIRPTAKRVLANILQHGFERGNLERIRDQGVITGADFDLLVGVDKIARYNEVMSPWRIKIHGFRDILERNDRAQRLTEFVTVGGQNPSMDADIDYKEVLRGLGEALSLDTDKLIRQNTPHDTAREENRILADDKMIQPHPDEEHQVHLNVHYEQVLITPNDATSGHIQVHAEFAAQMGLQIQPVPPEVLDIMGLNDEEPAPVNGAAVQ